MAKTVLVLGATGGVGGETARALAAHGWVVRGLSRSPREGDGIDWRIGDAMDRATVLAAAEGVNANTTMAAEGIASAVAPTCATQRGSRDGSFAGWRSARLKADTAARPIATACSMSPEASGQSRTSRLHNASDRPSATPTRGAKGRRRATRWARTEFIGEG